MQQPPPHALDEKECIPIKATVQQIIWLYIKRHVFMHPEAPLHNLEGHQAALRTTRYRSWICKDFVASIWFWDV